MSDALGPTRNLDDNTQSPTGSRTSTTAWYLFLSSQVRIGRDKKAFESNFGIERMSTMRPGAHKPHTTPYKYVYMGSMARSIFKRRPTGVPQRLVAGRKDADDATVSVCILSKYIIVWFDSGGCRVLQDHYRFDRYMFYKLAVP